MSNPIGHIADTIIREAIRSEFSIVQIKLEANKMEVHFQREGVSHLQWTMPPDIFVRVTTRYKIWTDVDLLNRRYPLTGQFSMVHARRHFNIEVVWEDPRLDPRVTMRIVAGEEAQVDEDGPEDMTIL